MVAEASHKAGEKGVALAKQYLEGTTHIELPFDAYETPEQTTLIRLDGKRKAYDLAGHNITTRRPLYVEVKKYNVVGKQPVEYIEYLANAYSITARDVAEGLDRKREFMWITWHPFHQTKWSKLTSKSEIEDALSEYPECLNGEEISGGVVDLVAGRLWLLMLNNRQEDLFLTREELYRVQATLQRKGA
ncbi:hypothetical protein OG923_18170 [Streptomyces halstedii]|uniref:hypothetical protein n=1 Tax=Streptomyces halstedii TaxID=1944 RepID=UPI003248DB1F